MSFEIYAKIDIKRWNHVKFDSKKAFITSFFVAVLVCLSFIPSFYSTSYVAIIGTSNFECNLNWSYYIFTNVSFEYVR